MKCFAIALYLWTYGERERERNGQNFSPFYTINPCLLCTPVCTMGTWSSSENILNTKITNNNNNHNNDDKFTTIKLKIVFELIMQIRSFVRYFFSLLSFFHFMYGWYSVCMEFSMYFKLIIKCLCMCVCVRATFCEMKILPLFFGRPSRMDTEQRLNARAHPPKIVMKRKHIFVVTFVVDWPRPCLSLCKGHACNELF